MKIKLTIPMLAILTFWNLGFSQHIPECGGNAHGSGNCRGYAVGLAYNLQWNNYLDDCYLNTLEFDHLPDNDRFKNHTEQSLQTILDSVFTQDIIAWNGAGDHAAFVMSNTGNTVYTIAVKHRFGDGTPYTGDNLAEAINRVYNDLDPNGWVDTRDTGKKQITVTNNFNSHGDLGENTVVGTTDDAPQVHGAWVGTYVNVTAINNQVIHNVTYTFVNWSTSSTNLSISYGPVTGSATVTANFHGYPGKITGFQFDCDVGENIKFNWTIHPNENVQYRIYRKVKDVQGPTLLATLVHDSTSYTDNDYKKTAGYTDDLLYYDVRAYYTAGNNETPDAWHAVYGEMGAQIVQQDNTVAIGIIPNEFSLSNYPNPFNPTTSIQYSLPEKSIVKLGIYNLNGNKVREWNLNEQSAGIRKITWDGNDHNGNRVPAGVYIYKLDATAVNSGKYYSDKKKMILMK